MPSINLEGLLNEELCVMISIYKDLDAPHKLPIDASTLLDATHKLPIDASTGFKWLCKMLDLCLLNLGAVFKCLLPWQQDQCILIE